MILPFDKISRNDADKAGGKGASLGEMTRSEIAIPPGFVVLTETFEEFVDNNNLRAEIQTILEHLDHNNVGSIEHASEEIQELIRGGVISEKIQKEIQKYTKTIKTDYVAVRSSATAEDGAEHAWAGQLDTYLNVSKTDIIGKIQSCWASLFTPRALFYRSEKGLRDLHISVAVVVQSMVDAESAGVAFSVHPVTENTDEIVIEGSWGLGEAVVSGEVTPDSFVISKSSGEIISEHIAEKKKGIFRNTNGENEWKTIEKQEQEKSILSKKELSELAQLIIKIENHYGFPCDIEWAFSGGKLNILQARPITTLKQKKSEINPSSLSQAKIIKDNYIRLFSWDGYIPFGLGYDFVMAYKDLGAVSLSNQNIWLSYMDQKSLEKTNFEGISIYGDKDEYERLKAKMYDIFYRIGDVGQSFLNNRSEKYISKNVKEILNLFYQFRILYQKTEFIYTDKIYELRYQYPDFKEIENTFEHFKLDGRTFLNQIFFEPNCWYNRVLEKVANYLNINIEKLKLLSSIEIENLLDKIIDLNNIEITKRGEQYFIYSESSEIKYFLGEDSKFLIDDFISNKKENNKLIRGKIAQPGKYTGITKIINIGLKNHAELPKIISEIPTGCVLVTETTEPRIIEACKKAGAIITNQGGMLSHAAIISRELKIPCIIGTKNATKILNDGDLVEVDAENGVVKILERNTK